MAQLLIRNVPEETRRELKLRAAQSGRSQNDVALGILNDALLREEKTWLSVLADVRREYGGVDLELPAREPGRDFNWGA